MNDDRLKHLLQRANEHGEPGLLPADEMLRRVENTARRQRQRKTAALALIVSLAFVVTGVIAWRRSPNAEFEAVDQPAIATSTDSTLATEPLIVQIAPDELERIRQELAALEAEANLHLQIARRMIADRERDATLVLARRALTDDEPTEAVREQLDLVAYRMIARADRLRSEPHPKEDPTEIYRDIVRLFPTTDSAAEARLRLAELDPIQPPGGA